MMLVVHGSFDVTMIIVVTVCVVPIASACRYDYGHCLPL